MAINPATATSTDIDSILQEQRKFEPSERISKERTHFQL